MKYLRLFERFKKFDVSDIEDFMQLYDDEKSCWMMAKGDNFIAYRISGNLRQIKERLNRFNITNFVMNHDEIIFYNDIIMNKIKNYLFDVKKKTKKINGRKYDLFVNRKEIRWAFDYQYGGVLVNDKITELFSGEFNMPGSYLATMLEIVIANDYKKEIPEWSYLEYTFMGILEFELNNEIH